MNSILIIGYILNISSYILFFILLMYFYSRNMFSFIELSEQLKSKRNKYGYISMAILLFIPFCMLVKCLINVIIITSDKTSEEKARLISKFNLIKEFK